MKMFGSGISYLTIDLIGIWKTSDEHDFAEKRDRYPLIPLKSKSSAD